MKHIIIGKTGRDITIEGIKDNGDIFTLNLCVDAFEKEVMEVLLSSEFYNYASGVLNGKVQK